MFSIDYITYDKARLHPLIPGQLRGYNQRSTKLSGYRSVLVHTTNGRRGSTFHSEAMYLVNSNDVAADYLIGKGRTVNEQIIAQILNPVLYTAWHSGGVRATAYTNTYSIGIEMHNTPTEGHCTEWQLAALDWLVRKLLVDYGIDYRMVETHRFAAIPAGRKIDPSGFPDNEFYAWRNTLQPLKRYQVISTTGVNVRQAPNLNAFIAGTLEYNAMFDSDVLKDDENGQYLNGTNKWAHMISGLGFVHLSNLKEL